MLAISLDPRMEKLDVWLRAKGRLGAASLLRNMVLKAEKNESYDVEMRKWLDSKDTLQLRELVKPFGDYWAGVEFQNLVDEIDTAAIKI